MALSNGISGEFLSPAPLSGQLNPGEATVINHTDRQWLLVENVAYLYLKCALKSYIMEV